MTFSDLPAPLLSEDLQAIIGMAVIDSTFQQLLLTHPRRALAGFELSAADRRAAVAIAGASSLAEYAVLLEQRIAGRKRRRVAVLKPAPEHWERARAAG